MLNGELLRLLTAAQYLSEKISISGGDTSATQRDLEEIGLLYQLPATLSQLLGLVEDEIKEVYLKIKKLIGKEYWDAILKDYDDNLTDYLSKK